MYVLASESCALDAIGAEFVRDIEAGEMVVIDDNGVESIKYKESTKKQVHLNISILEDQIVL